jgi:Zn-dependent protease with chaperone function
MEQTTQQITQKLSLPIKTKVAAWWMIVFAGIGIILSIKFILSYLFIYFGGSWGQESGWALVAVFMGVIAFLPCLFFLLSGIFLFKKKRWTWWFATVILVLLIIFLFLAILKFDINITNTSAILILPLPITLLPFILLLLDRKNFFKIAS